MTEKKMVASSTKTAAIRTAMMKTQDYYMDAVIRQSAAQNIQFDAEQIACGNALLSAMQEAMDSKGLTIQKMDQTKLVRAIQEATLLRLNANANPRECYVIIRTPRNSMPYFDFGIMGDGYDKILRRYGVGVKTVHPYWLVREHDDFSYPAFNGLEISPPTWKPKDMTSKVIRVVYPIEMESGTILWSIAEREDVKRNLLAHIHQNLMYDKEHPNLMERLEDMSLDQIFKDKEALGVMSPAWSEPYSRESMIIRKMRNNATRSIQKDFGNAFIQAAYEDAESGEMNIENAVDVEVKSSVGTEPVEAPTVNPETGEIQDDLPKVEEDTTHATKEAPVAKSEAVEPF